MVERTDAAKESTPGTAGDSPAPAEEKKKGRLKPLVAVGILGLGAVGAAAYMAGGLSGDGGDGDAGTYKTVGPVVEGDYPTPDADKVAEDIIKEAEGEVEAEDSGPVVTEPPKPSYTSELTGVSGAVLSEGETGVVLDRNGDGLGDYNEAYTREDIDDKIRIYDLEGLYEKFPEINSITKIKYDDDYDGEWDRVEVMINGEKVYERDYIDGAGPFNYLQFWLVGK